MIRVWSDAMQGRGVYTEINRSHDYLAEALHVLPGSHDDPWWLVHKTPDGATALRLWPGVARIVPTVDEALATIAAAIDVGANVGRVSSGQRSGAA